METQLSRRTIEQYLPIIKAIYAYLEVRIKTRKDLDAKNQLDFIGMEREYGFSGLSNAGRVLRVWLEGSDFDCDSVVIVKLNKDAKWTDFIELFDKKIDEYQDNANIVEISLSSAGIMFREINGKLYRHDFKNDGLKKKIITALSNKKDFTKTPAILKFIDCANAKSFSEAVRQINTITEKKLSLPKNQKLIQSKKNSGYRINPLYNIILSD